MSERLKLLSIEVTNRCSKSCWFCYNSSSEGGGTGWTVEELVSFLGDCAANGVEAVSFGGGEPLEYEGLMEVARRLPISLYKSATTNGLLLSGAKIAELKAAGFEKVHVSLHFPERCEEVERVMEQVLSLRGHGIAAGVNLLVSRQNVEAAATAATRLRAMGIGNESIVYLPMRKQLTPSAKELARVAGGGRFQSMSCLGGCGASPRFASVGWDRRVAWCSYTSARAPLNALTHDCLVRTLSGLRVDFCGGTE